VNFIGNQASSLQKGTAVRRNNKQERFIENTTLSIAGQIVPNFQASHISKRLVMQD